MKAQLVLFAVALPGLGFSQGQEGMIIFEETVQLRLELPEGHEEMARMMPSSQSFKMALHFNKEASLYENYEAEEGGGSAEWSGSDGGATVRVVMQRPENKIFKNLGAGKKVELREFMGKRFLIEDELDSFQWKLTGEQRMVLGYPCTKAVHTDSAGTITAWFTPQIPISSGPGIYGQLPGMALAVDINNGERTITAIAVALGDNEKPLAAPGKGKQVSQAEFDKIVEEKRKEMEESGEGGMIIRIRN